MFDLIDESGKDLKSYGYISKDFGKYGISLSTLKIESDEKSKKLGLDKGEYNIINCPNFYDYDLVCGMEISQIYRKEIKKTFKRF